jgi:hypothetical protein
MPPQNNESKVGPLTALTNDDILGPIDIQRNGVPMRKPVIPAFAGMTEILLRQTGKSRPAG